MSKINHLSTQKITPQIPVPEIIATSIQQSTMIRGLIVKREISVIKILLSNSKITQMLSFNVINILLLELR